MAERTVSAGTCSGRLYEEQAHLDAEAIYASFSADEGRAVPIPGWVQERIGLVE